MDVEGQEGLELTLATCSGCGVSSCYSEMELDCYNGYESDEESPIIFTTLESRCEQLYLQGLEFQQGSDLEAALSCFLRCLEGMQKCEYFAKLPQTLHQLAKVCKALDNVERAEDYAKAERLFYEAVSESPVERGDVAKQKPKRKPFSKKPRSLTSGVCNPADYFPVLTKKADEFDRLARLCAMEGNFECALDHCGNAASIRGCIYGQQHFLTAASLDYYGLLYTQASISKASVGANCRSNFHTSESDLSRTLCTERNGTLQSALCVGAQPVLSSTSLDNGPSSLAQYTPDKENHLPQPKDSTAQMEGNAERNFPQGSIAQYSERSVSGALSNEGCRLDATPTQSWQCQSRESDQLGHKECITNGIQDLSRQDSVELDQDSARGKLLLKNTRPSPEANVCTGVRNNLTKLSELKPPLCVNLDPHKGAGEDSAQTRCLPLWVLLLPAFLALVAYMFYYH